MLDSFHRGVTGAPEPVARGGGARAEGDGVEEVGAIDEGLTRRVIFPVRIAFSSFRRSASDTFSNIGLVLSANAWIRRRM
jgi:hypothetical protein